MKIPTWFYSLWQVFLRNAITTKAFLLAGANAPALVKIRLFISVSTANYALYFILRSVTEGQYNGNNALQIYPWNEIIPIMHVDNFPLSSKYYHDFKLLSDLHSWSN